MISAILTQFGGQIIAYILAALGFIASLGFVYNRGKTNQRIDQQLKQLEADAKSRERIDNVEITDAADAREWLSNRAKR